MCSDTVLQITYHSLDPELYDNWLYTGGSCPIVSSGNLGRHIYHRNKMTVSLRATCGVQSLRFSYLRYWLIVKNLVFSYYPIYQSSCNWSFSPSWAYSVIWPHERKLRGCTEYRQQSLSFLVVTYLHVVKMYWLVPVLLTLIHLVFFWTREVII